MLQLKVQYSLSRSLSRTGALSFSLPFSLSSSLLLLLEVPKEISSLDTIQGGDVNGKPFRQVNVEGNTNTGHEIKKRGKEERNLLRR